MGCAYAIGKGVTKDAVKGYAWLSVAKASGGRNLANMIGLVENMLTQAQILEGQALATEIWERLQTKK